MPKKTKKEKILAEYRKKLNTLKKSMDKENEKVVSRQILTKNVEKPLKKEEKEDKTALTYFRKDLKKSLFYISLVIVLEVLLYFVKI